jgi:hypothetical protein
MNAVVCWYARVTVVAGCLSLLTSTSAAAQSTSSAPAAGAVQDAVEFVGGGVLGLGMHEGGHLLFDVLFDARPRLSGVHLGPFPFFAITHRSDLTPRREFTVSSAGFWVQDGTSEWLLARKPFLRDEPGWFAKGLLAFNVLNSFGYAMVAFAKAGPPERDTRGIADSAGLDERIVGAVVLAPAVLDGYRYFRRGSDRAAWASRVAKIGSVLLVIRRR